MVQSVLSNICILLLVYLCIQTLYFKSDWTFLTPKRVKLFHILFVSSGIIGMFYTPIFIGDYRFDLRTIPITFLALLKGPSYTIPALTIASVWRWMIGGHGAIPGIVFGLVLPSLFALTIYHLKIIKKFSYIQGFILFSIFWLISDLPIIFLVPSGWDVFQQIALTRFLSFHIGAFILYFFIRLGMNHVQLVRKLQFYADHDPLTHLYNMRKFVEVVNSKKGIDSCYIAMMDIDFFKSINDTYGHRNGDEVLKKLAHILNSFHPERMIVGRYGGEEFIICVLARHEAEAIDLLDRLRRCVEHHTFLTTDGHPIRHITVSAGIAPLDHNAGIEKAIEQADQYLYIAKQTGRNRIISSTKSLPSLK